MRGKVAFVLGAAVGYVLGTRAGRERYEQIKRGTKAAWESAPVQQGVDTVQGVVGDQLEALKARIFTAISDVFAARGRTSSSGSSAAAQKSSSSATTSSAAATNKSAGAASASAGADGGK
ncbi:YtxH domain-containing protein [Leucobacter sp. GX24907]